jgi:hypothetical protein
MRASDSYSHVDDNDNNNNRNHGGITFCLWHIRIKIIKGGCRGNGKFILEVSNPFRVFEILVIKDLEAHFEIVIRKNAIEDLKGYIQILFYLIFI